MWTVGSAPHHLQSAQALSGGHLHWGSHWAAQVALASSCPSCPETPRLRGRKTCPRSHTKKEEELRHHPVLSAPGLELCLQVPSLAPAEPLGMARRGGMMHKWRGFRHVQESRRESLKYNISEFCSLVCPAPGQLPCTQGHKGPFSGTSMWLGAQGAGPRTWGVFPGLSLLTW